MFGDYNAEYMRNTLDKLSVVRQCKKNRTLPSPISVLRLPAREWKWKFIQQARNAVLIRCVSHSLIFCHAGSLAILIQRLYMRQLCPPVEEYCGAHWIGVLVSRRKIFGVCGSPGIHKFPYQPTFQWGRVVSKQSCWQPSRISYRIFHVRCL